MSIKHGAGGNRYGVGGGGLFNTGGGGSNDSISSYGQAGGGGMSDDAEIARLREEYLRLKYENAVMQEALAKLSDKSNYYVDRGQQIEWEVPEDRELTPWEFAKSIVAKVTHE